MKNPIIILAVLLSFSSCKKDQVDNQQTEVETYGLDTTLYPDDWVTFTRPDFTPNTNTDRNVLLENFEGHRCPNSVNGDTKARELADLFPGRVLPVTIHASPSGLSIFQETADDCGTVNNPLDMYCDTLYCDEGLAIGETFGNAGQGFIGVPQGTVNRKYHGSSSIFFSPQDWGSDCQTEITANLLDLNIQAQSDYFPLSGGVYLYAQVNMINSLSNADLNMVGYIVDNEHVSWQDSIATPVEDYAHFNVLRGCIDNNPWGTTINGSYNQGAVYDLNYSFTLPAGSSAGDYHILLYVYDPSTYEVYQVIRHDLD
jgi:hypothetical protein